MNTRIKYILVFLLFTLTICSYTQNEFMFRFGSSLPLGDFKDKTEDANVTIGYGAGLEYTYFLNDMFGVFGSFDIYINKVTKEYMDFMEQTQFVTDNTIYPNYLNMPISAGAYGKYDLTDGLGIYGRLGGCIHLLKMTDFHKRVGGDFDNIESYKLSVSPGLIVGFGLIFKGKVELGANLVLPATHNVKGELDLGDIKKDIDEMEKKTGIITTTVGIRF